MRYSRRLPDDLTPTALAAGLRGRSDLVDLTESNPTRCGFAYPPAVTRAVAAGGDPSYAPDPRGLASARAAVAAYLGQRGESVEPEHVLLCASTSEAYAFLLKLWCEPGESVAVPAPSYPLLDVLAQLEAVTAVRYRLTFDGAWRLDVHSLAERLEQGARAVVAIEPNNPTGSFLWPADAAEVARLCRQHGVPLIVDEVFAPYPAGARRRAAALLAAPLTVRLDGLSKAAALPQAKLSWMVLDGEEALVAAARARLEWIADAYLSVATPIQLALPEILAAAPELQAQIRRRVTDNREVLRAALGRVPAVSLLPSDGGWTAVLRVPRLLADDELVLRLAERAGVIVHPGYFYDFPDEGYLVVSLLLPPDRFADAVRSMVRALHELAD